MDARLQKRVQRYGWDEAAATYERSWQAQLEPAQSALLEMANFKPGDRVLDVACGTGLVMFLAAKAVAPGGEALGTDISEEMIAIASALAPVQGIANCRFRRKDTEELALEDGTFDGVLCALGLMYVLAPERAVVEMRRILKPGGPPAGCVSGKSGSAVWGERRNCGWADIFPRRRTRAVRGLPNVLLHRHRRLPRARTLLRGSATLAPGASNPRSTTPAPRRPVRRPSSAVP